MSAPIAATGWWGDERGSCGGALFCRFHNWAYSDRGELVGVPDEENFFGLDKREHGLTPVDTDIWEGFVFVHLDPAPAQTLREYSEASPTGSTAARSTNGAVADLPGGGTSELENHAGCAE